MTFSSQYGMIAVNSLPVISINGYAQQPQQNFIAPQQYNEAPAFQQPSTAQDGDVFGKIERLADLFQKGILTEQEFTTKKNGAAQPALKLWVGN